LEITSAGGTGIFYKYVLNVIKRFLAMHLATTVNEPETELFGLANPAMLWHFGIYIAIIRSDCNQYPLLCEIKNDIKKMYKQ